MGAAGLAAAPAAAQAAPQSAPGADVPLLPAYTRAHKYKSLKQSSFDLTGGNRDSWNIAPGAAQEVFNAQGPGVISHIWFTIAARGGDHLKELVLRALLGRQREAQRGSARRRLLRAEPEFVFQLRIAVPGMLAGEIAELLFCDAVQTVGAPDRDERGQAGGRLVLFEHRLHDRAVAARRRALFPRAIPAERSLYAGDLLRARRSIPTARRITSTWRRAAAGI